MDHISLLILILSNQGLSQLIHEDQPTFSLVSNGAECILINKRFYMDNVTKDLMNTLRMEVTLKMSQPPPLPILLRINKGFLGKVWDNVSVLSWSDVLSLNYWVVTIFLQVSPYPSEAELQSFLQVYVDWENSRSSVIVEALFKNKLKKVNVFDARSCIEQQTSNWSNWKRFWLSVRWKRHKEWYPCVFSYGGMSIPTALSSILFMILTRNPTPLEVTFFHDFIASFPGSFRGSTGLDSNFRSFTFDCLKTLNAHGQWSLKLCFNLSVSEIQILAHIILRWKNNSWGWSGLPKAIVIIKPLHGWGNYNIHFQKNSDC